MFQTKNSKKQILFLIHRYPGIGGIERITTILAYLFRTMLNYNVSIFSISKQSNINLDYKIQEAGIQFYLAQENTRDSIKEEFITIVNKLSVDVIIFQDSYAQIDYLLESISNDIRIITVEHNTPDAHLKEYINRWQQHRWFSLHGLPRKLLFPFVYYKIKRDVIKRHRSLLSKSDRYVLLSESYRKTLSSMCNDDSQHVLSIPNIKNSFGECEILNHFIYNRSKQVLFVGRLTVQKGLVQLIQVWRIIERTNTGYELLIVGDGEERHLLEKLIEKYKLKQIHIKGYQNNVETYYKSASAIFMTSIFEGFPMVLHEAMQFGVVPFVYDTYSALHDIVQDGENGYIVHPFDAKTFAQKFLHFCNMSENEVRSLRMNAINSSNKTSKEIVLQQWANLLENL